MGAFSCRTNPVFIHKVLSCIVGDILFKGIFDAGFFDVAKNTYEPHMHLQYELHIVAEGKYILEDLDGTESKILKKGMVALIPPKYYHNCITDVEAKTAKYGLRIEISSGKFKNEDGAENLYDVLKRELESLGRGIHVFSMPDAVEILRSLYNCLTEEKLGNKTMAEVYYKMFMTQFVLKFYKSTRKEEKTHDDYDTATVRKDKINYALSNGCSETDFNVKVLAERLSLSVRQVNRVVLEFYGMTFQQLLSETRLNRARKMLQRTDMSIEKIAEQVGYGSSTGLFIAFKKKYGIAPGRFRRQSREE